MKKLLSLFFVLLLLSCGKDKTLDQQNREKLEGTWTAECVEDGYGGSQFYIMEDIYGDEYNSTTFTIKNIKTLTVLTRRMTMT